MKLIYGMTMALVSTFQAMAQEPQAVPLWPTGVLGTADKDIPTLTPYPAKPGQATGACVVILMGPNTSRAP